MGLGSSVMERVHIQVQIHIPRRAAYGDPAYRSDVAFSYESLEVGSGFVGDAALVVVGGGGEFWD